MESSISRCQAWILASMRGPLAPARLAMLSSGIMGTTLMRISRSCACLAARRCRLFARSGRDQRRRYGPARPSYEHATWKRLEPFFKLPGQIVWGQDEVHISLRPFNDRQLNGDLAIVCERVATAAPQLPDGRRLAVCRRERFPGHQIALRSIANNPIVMRFSRFSPTNC